MRRFSVLLLTVLLAASTLTGCVFWGAGPDDGEEPVDLERTQLYVGNFNGGVGNAWLYAVKEEFEKFYAAESFETGKTGVQIIIDDQKAGFQGTSLMGTMSGSRDSVFFTETVNYYDFVASNALADITDAVSTPLTEFGESKSVYDKLPAELKSYFKTSDDKIFALPFYEAFMSAYIDVDLFESKNLYLKAGASADGIDINNPGAVMSLFVTSAQEARSAGPDGDSAATYDNGLPATYADFKALMKRMKIQNIIPFIWTGMYPVYAQNFFNGVWADAAGAEQLRLKQAAAGAVITC
jgi:hypothetical protein